MSRVTLIALGFFLGAIATQAYGNGVPSDELLVTSATGEILFDQFIFEDAASPAELAAVWNPDINVNGGMTSLAYAAGNGGQFVFLLEPVGSVANPGEPWLSTPYGNVSDVVVYIPALLTVGGRPAIGLFSDPHPIFSDYFTPEVISNTSANHFIEETGTLQDLTGLLGGFPDAVNVSVLSGAETVPLPPAAWLFGGALGLLGAVRRRSAA